MKIALIHDWFIVNGGSEKVVREILQLLANHDVEIFSLLDYLSPEDREFIVGNRKINTSFIQNLPWARTRYRNYLPLFPWAIEQFDLRKFDVIISSSHSVAKGIKKQKNQRHICYCHTPSRYLWDLHAQYLDDHRLNGKLMRWLGKPIFNAMRAWDYESAQHVDAFIANSQHVKERIEKNYGQPSTIIFPPVDTAFYGCVAEKEDFYVTASRMVPYKKVELIAEAFSQLPDKKLVIIGDGPNYNRVMAQTSSNIQVIRFDTREVLRHYLQRARAFVFAAEEDFGITPVEALSCGTPVIAYGKGGALETVEDGKTGLFYPHQTAKSLVDAVYRFENLAITLKAEDCHARAEQFNREKFRAAFCAFTAQHTQVTCLNA